jgi:hypothetical protein
MWNLGNKVFLENGHGRLTRRSIFALSVAELRHPPLLEGAEVKIDGLMKMRP